MESILDIAKVAKNLRLDRSQVQGKTYYDILLYLYISALFKPIQRSLFQWLVINIEIPN